MPCPGQTPQPPVCFEARRANLLVRLVSVSRKHAASCAVGVPAIACGPQHRRSATPFRDRGTTSLDDRRRVPPSNRSEERRGVGLPCPLACVGVAVAQGAVSPVLPVMQRWMGCLLSAETTGETAIDTAERCPPRSCPVAFPVPTLPVPER